MSPSQRQPQSKEPFRFLSDEGRALCQELAAKHFPYDPHDVQFEAVSKLLDRVNVFAILPTGMGKTSIISMYLKIMISILSDPSLCPEIPTCFKQNPCVIVILPTKYLEHQMADIMSEAGLRTLVINLDTIHSAQTASPRRDLWKEAITEPHVIFMAPEQLISPGCSALLRKKDFTTRICCLVVDEAHLLNTWGASFRKAYKQIGWVRARLPDVVQLALSATVRHDDLPIICKFLGLHPGAFHLLKRSNARPEIQILFRSLKSGIGGKRFPELDWILTEKRRTIIFCQTINLGSRVYEYLCKKGRAADVNIRQHIRMYNALNWAEFNEATRDMLQNDPDCRIAIGTDTMSVGVDIRTIEDVVVLDKPENIDELIQKFGRVGCDQSQVKDPRAILYTSSKTQENAQSLVDGASTKKPLDSSTTAMDLSMAYLHLATCKPAEIDRQYGNSDDPSCQCTGCSSSTPLPIRECNCSGCLPEVLPHLSDTPRPPAPQNSVPKGKRVTKAMRAHGTESLLAFRRRVWQDANERETSFLLPSVFLPDSEVKLILDQFALITSVDSVKNLLRANPYLTGSQHQTLYETIVKLRDEFKKIAADRKEELRLEKEQKKLESVIQLESQSSDFTSGSDSESDFSAEELPNKDRNMQTAPQWRIIKAGTEA